MGQQLNFISKLKLLSVGVVKTSLNRALIKLIELNPKPSDLVMNRLKIIYIDIGGPNPHMWKNVGMICD